MASRACAACGRDVITALVSAGVERVFDAEPVEGGEWGVWSQSNRLTVVQRARLHTPDNHFGTTGHALHRCPGAAGQQLEIGAA